MNTLQHVVAVAPGLVTPRSDEAPAGCTAQGFRGKGSISALDPAGNCDERKAWVRVQARLVLAGFLAELTKGDDAQTLLIVSRWALSRSFSNLGQAQAWAHRVGARS